MHGFLQIQSIRGALAKLFPGLAPAPSSALLPILADIIQKEGPITVERYMEIVLQHSEHGYYRRGDPIGNGSDFNTAPEISQMFGEMLGLWCVCAWERLGKPSPFVLLELGPGHGTLMHDLLNFTTPVEGFHDALRLRLFESNDTLRAAQAEKLAKYKPVYINNLDELEALPTIVVANEFFDNIPIKQFIWTGRGWREGLVDFREGKLELVQSAYVLPELPDSIAISNLRDVPPGWVREISYPARAIVAQLAKHIVKNKGSAAIIDYGYADPPGHGTLDAWYRSKPTTIFMSPGNTDVTVDVDLYALALEAEAAGAHAEDIVGQGRFLLKLGIADRAEFLKTRAPRASRRKIDSALNALVLPSRMGVEWKALVLHSEEPKSDC